MVASRQAIPVRIQSCAVPQNPRLLSPQLVSLRGRGFYFEDPNGHFLEVITRPYGSGGYTP